MAAPMGPAVAGKNDWSISLVNTLVIEFFCHEKSPRMI